MRQGLTQTLSTFFEAMACCDQATSHYFKQCWLRFLSTYVITRPQWVNFSIHSIYNIYISLMHINNNICVSYIYTIFHESVTNYSSVDVFFVEAQVLQIQQKWHKWDIISNICISWSQWVNFLRAKFFRGNKNIHLHFLSFFHTDMT